MSLIIFVDKLHLDSDDFTRFNLLGVCWCVWPTAIPSSSATRSSLGHPHSQTTWLGWGLHHRQPRRKHVTQTWARRVAPPTDHSDCFSDGHTAEAGPIGVAPTEPTWWHITQKLVARWQPFNVMERPKGQRSHPLAPARSSGGHLDR